MSVFFRNALYRKTARWMTPAGRFAGAGSNPRPARYQTALNRCQTASLSLKQTSPNVQSGPPPHRLASGAPFPHATDIDVQPPWP